MHYNYFRDYDAEIGHYITSDPLGLVAGMSTYGYVEQNPVNNVDFLGLQTYRYPGNRFEDHQITGLNGCEKPIYVGEYIIGWQPCLTVNEEMDAVCDDSQIRALPTQNIQVPVSSPTPILHPEGDPLDGWEERYVDYWKEVDRKRAEARSECLTHIGLGIARNLVIEQVAERGLSRLGLQGAAHSVPVAGEVVLFSELVMGTGCIIRYPF